jgi:hypothetical protein
VPALERAIKTGAMEPALLHGKPVEVRVSMTALFGYDEREPRVLLFVHANEAELARGSDYIQAQLIKGTMKKLEYPNAASAVWKDARAIIRVGIDATGTIDVLQVVEEDPPDLGFGRSALAA